ncbi:MAG: AMP-binding protein, partial [Acidimicrobiales bacterium]|nr:AMP-binding protein [Acidimicrobiales bacterium]
MTTVAELLLARAEDDSPGLLHEDGTWTYRQIVEEGRRRAALYQHVHEPGTPPHIGVLLDNAPDYIFWLAAAALSGSVIVGINSTYRGGPLAQLIDHSDCDILVTSRDLVGLLDGTPTTLAPDDVLLIDDPAYAERLATVTPAAPPATPIVEDDLFLLVFTSGSTGLPKAVRCTQGRLARTGAHVTALASLGDGDVVYAPLPFFHAASLFTAWSSTLHAGIPIATRRTFSASRTAEDIRRWGATVATYTGKVLNYILAVPERPDDAEVPLRLAVGNEASEQDIRAFARRYGCDVRDSYGSTEGVVIIRRDPSMPAGALGQAAPTVKVLDPDTM